MEAEERTKGRHQVDDVDDAYGGGGGGDDDDDEVEEPRRPTLLERYKARRPVARGEPLKLAGMYRTRGEIEQAKSTGGGAAPSRYIGMGISKSSSGAAASQKRDTARAFATKRAVGGMPAREKAARDKSLSMLEALPIEERIRLYRRVHAARKTIAKRVAELTDPDRDKRHAATLRIMGIQPASSEQQPITAASSAPPGDQKASGAAGAGAGAGATPREVVAADPNYIPTPRTPREMDAAGERILREVVEAERREEALAAALEQKLAESKKKREPQKPLRRREVHRKEDTEGPGGGGEKAKAKEVDDGGGGGGGYTTKHLQRPSSSAKSKSGRSRAKARAPEAEAAAVLEGYSAAAAAGVSDSARKGVPGETQEDPVGDKKRKKKTSKFGFFSTKRGGDS